MNAAASIRPYEGKRVLLAEDDDDARKVLAAVLGDLGFDVVQVADGGRMLVALTSLYREGRSPDELDLVITDVHMPVASGIDLFKALRAAHWKTPVIVMTAFDSARIREAVARHGARLLIKPLDLDALEETIRELMGRPRRP